MQKIITIFLLCAPILSWAQLSAPADYMLPTTDLTGNDEYIYVFYDDAVMSLTATQPNGHNAEFTWKKLNVPNVSLDQIYWQDWVVSSTINNIEEGGYQVTVLDLDDPTAPVDTFTTWVFRDKFRIDEVRTAFNDCDGLRLDIYTTPAFYTRYTIYHFERFLSPPHGGETQFGQVQRVEWTPVTNIYPPDITDYSESWRTFNRGFAIIDAPPPLRDAAYHLEVTDIFGRSATYTTGTVTAVAVKAIPFIQEYVDDSWRNAGELPNGEALYKLKFQHDKSANANQYQWKGFDNALQPNGDKKLVWTETTTNANAEIVPQMPYKGEIYDGYTPGSYQIRLIVRNNHGCADSVKKYITVVPSSFDAEAIPNAFTPNNDGRNDIFTFVKEQEPKSMEIIYVYIYNRSGGMVYRYEGRSDAWEGWDGRMMGTGSNVSEGVYYYIITGKGWDDVVYDTKKYSGYLHLFR